MVDNDVTRTRQVAVAPAVGRRAWLQVLSGAPPARIPVERDSLSVGRSRDADLRFDADGVSRMHARIVRSGPTAINLVDLGAKNGTFVNGSAVDMAALHHGDRIQIGAVVLQFSREEEPEHSTTHVASVSSDSRVRSRLSNREWEVAQHVANGQTNAQVAEALGISRRTVATHLERIYARLEIHSRAALANLVARDGGGPDPA